MEKYETLPRLISFHEENGVLTLIEEYVHGITADEMLKQHGPFSADAAKKIALAICDILHGLHSQDPPLIHRDIKPSNIMIGQNQEIWLLDFNAIREIKKDASRDTRLMGTPEFAAPEQYGFGQSDVRTDIYGLGITLNVLLTGSLPSETDRTPPFREIISRCTQIDPQGRYANVDVLRLALINTRKTSWRTYLPVGFRTGKWWHMAIAIFIYAFCGYMVYDITWSFEDDVTRPLVHQLLYKGAILGSMVFLIALFGNYRGFRDRLPGCNGRGLLSIFATIFWVLSVPSLLLVLCVLFSLFI